MERDDQNWDGHNFVRDFNSHAHVERDTGYYEQFYTPYISTHTLTWSVTEPYKIMVKDYHFNSHAHVERDVKLLETG